MKYNPESNQYPEKLFTITNKRKWNEILEIQSELDITCIRILNYMVIWGQLMEEAVAEGEKLSEVASNLSYVANEGLNLSGSAHNIAIGVLFECWVHGKELESINKAKKI